MTLITLKKKKGQKMEVAISLFVCLWAVKGEGESLLLIFFLSALWIHTNSPFEQLHEENKTE